MSVANTVLALNGHDLPYESGGLDCTGSVSSLGYTLLQHPAGCSYTGSTGDLTGGNPQLGPLWAATVDPHRRTLRLPGSPLIDHGSPAKVGSDVTDACSRQDQRGTPRPTDGDKDGVARCDIGAAQRQSSDGTEPIPAQGYLWPSWHGRATARAESWPPTRLWLNLASFHWRRTRSARW